MNKKLLFIGAIVLIAIVVGVIYFYPNSQPEPKTYDECVQQILKDVQKYKSASEEPIGAKRTDDKGNVWAKQEDGWKTNAQGFENTAWGDALIDEQKGGANYMPESFPECEKYIFTPNNEMEQRFSEIVNEVIQEQSQKGITISVEEIEVLNLAGRLQGHITLNCEKIDYETDREIIGSIAEKLIAEYPNEFAENSERDSWVDINGCSEMGTSPDGINTYYHTTTWRISEGYYDALI